MSVVLNKGDFFSGLDTGLAYEVQDELGRAGFGIIYKVEREDGNTYVAKAAIDGSERMIKLLRSEFNVLKKLQDAQVPHVVRPVEMAETTNSFGASIPILLMEVAAGQPLDSHLAGGTTLDEATTHDIVSKIAEGLNQIHDAGFIHQDISPENIFIEDLGGQNNVTIIGFGIAAAKAEKDTHVLVSMLIGTQFYSPPEQFNYNKLSIGTDIFSLGATAVEMLVGPTPKSQRQAPPHDVHQIDSKIDQHFRDVIMKATWDTRAGRFATMQDMVDALGGQIPDESVPRVVADGQVYRLDGIGPWVIGRAGSFQSVDIPVKETSTTGNYISRKHLVIERGQDGILKAKNQGFGGTKVFHAGRWIDLPAIGFPLGARHYELGLCFSISPPNEIDSKGWKIPPGPYKIIEYFPAKNT
jgi:serine/threonine protein kinase